MGDGPGMGSRPVRRGGAIGRSGPVRRRGSGMRRGGVGRCGPMGRRGTMAGHGLTRRPWCLGGTQAIAGRYGPAVSRRMGYPAGTSRAHSRLVRRARRLSCGATHPGPVLGPSATGGTGGHRRRGRVMGPRAGIRIRDPGGLWASLSLSRPDAVRGTVGPRVGEGPWVLRTARIPRGSLSPSPRVFRPADIPGHVEQAARRVHTRRIQDMRPGRTSPRPAPVTGAAMVCPGHPAALLAAPADERGNHQHDQTERDTCHARIQPQAAHTAPRRPRPGPHGQALDHQEHAERDRRGAHDRQDDDKSHPSAGRGIRAHCSTIASRLPPRKPYGQV